MGKCKVNDKWFQCSDKNGYLIGSWAKKSSETTLFCMVCQSDFNVGHGFSRIDQHVETKIHKNNYQTKLYTLQLKLEKVDSAWHENEVNSSGETDSFYRFIFWTTDKIYTTWLDETSIFKSHRKSSEDGIDVYCKISTVSLFTEWQ